MDIAKYFVEKGIDVSRSSNKSLKKVFVEPNNLYSLRDYVKFESLDFIYSNEFINETKFYKILLKEWFYFCKVGGNIIIEMRPNEILSFDELINEVDLLLGSKAKIVDKEFSGSSGILVINKIKPALLNGDSIDKWSFGIITDGKRKDWLEKEIDSIIALGIPHFEIIVCGNYCPKGKKNVKFIPFKPKIAWITKKKNLICQKAKYENLVITHDRYTFNKDWYDGMKKYGNYFEVLSCNVIDITNHRADDWTTYGMNLFVEKFDPVGNIGLLDYRDWDINGYIAGGLYILKKTVWKRCLWDESLMWGQGEDLVFSRDLLSRGFVSRFNPFSSCKTFSDRGRWHLFKMHKTRHVKLSDRPLLKSIKCQVRRICFRLLKI